MNFAKFILPFVVAFCVTASMQVRTGGQQSPSQDSTRPTYDAPVYLPPGSDEAMILTSVLGPLREPSFLEAASNASALSFRWTYFSFVPVREIVVRLDVNADGSGQITRAVSSLGKSTEFTRMNESVSAADVGKFLNLVEFDGFWSMSSSEEKKVGRDKVYVFDGSCWMVEGLRSGSFHYVFRRNPKPSSFTEVGRYLVKNLAKIDDSIISIPPYTSASQ